MTESLKAMHADSFGVSGVGDAELDAWIGEAYTEQLPTLRADSAFRSASPATEGARVALRQHVADQLARAQHATAGKSGRSRYNVDVEERTIELENAFADGLGWKAEDGVLTTPNLRTDSYFLPGDLTYRATQLIYPNERPEMIRTAAPIKSVPAYAELVDQDFVSFTGKAALYEPGMRSFPRADGSVRQSKTPLNWYCTSTVINWTQAIYGSVQAVDEVTLKARAARRALESLLESILCTAPAGVNGRGLNDLGIPTIFAQGNFGSGAGALTLGQKVSEVNRVLERFRASAGYTVMPSVGWVDPRLTDVFSRSNNIDAGGSMTGPEPVMSAFMRKGVSRLIEAPTMPLYLPSKRGPKWASVIAWAPGADGSLQHVVGMDIAPVSTADYHGTETLWAMKTGLWELGNLSAALRIDFQIEA